MPVMSQGGGLIGVVQGMATQYVTNGMAGSIISTQEQMARTIEAYEKQGSGTLDQTRWRSRNGLLYRDYGNETYEISPIQRPAGGGGTNDGGGGGTNDGGGGGTNDGGGFSSLTLNGAFYKRYHALPGVQLKGVPAVGFVVDPIGPIYADHAALNLFHTLPKLRPMPISLGGDLISVLKQKMASSNIAASSRDFVLSSATVSSTLGQVPQQVLVQGDKIYIHVTGPENESIDFSLNWHGALVGSSDPHFNPIVTVKGSAGHEYAFDLRSLFFTELSELRDYRKLSDSLNGLSPDSQREAKEALATLTQAAEKPLPPFLTFRKIERNGQNQIQGGKTFVLAFTEPRPVSDFKGKVDHPPLPPHTPCELQSAVSKIQEEYDAELAQLRLIYQKTLQNTSKP
jgi:hypothetical protein